MLHVRREVTGVGKSLALRRVPAWAPATRLPARAARSLAKSSRRQVGRRGQSRPRLLRRTWLRGRRPPCRAPEAMPSPGLLPVAVRRSQRERRGAAPGPSRPSLRRTVGRSRLIDFDGGRELRAQQSRATPGAQAFDRSARAPRNRPPPSSGRSPRAHCRRSNHPASRKVDRLEAGDERGKIRQG